MSVERTLAIIKPDAVSHRKSGAILSRIEDEAFLVMGMKQLHLTLAQAEGFYRVHQGRPFFANLTRFMSRGPIVVLSLERENAIAQWREVIGATDPAKAAPGTIRKLFGSSLEENAVHGSDARETAAWETAYFFGGYELAPLV